MGLNRIREDSVAELNKKKTLAQLQTENEQLQNKVTTLEEQLDSTQLALCDVYEQVLAVTATNTEEA